MNKAPKKPGANHPWRKSSGPKPLSQADEKRCEQRRQQREVMTDTKRRDNACATRERSLKIGFTR